jgi:nicotinamidase/pyrazinamidase
MKALIMVDLQNDFLPGGALEVREGDGVIPVINSIQHHFEWVVATRDWHPAGHGSFASSHPGTLPGEIISLNGLDQILWPDHCIQGNSGADIASALDKSRINAYIFKGTEPSLDSYSTFFDNAHRRETGLATFLRDREIQELYLCGLATDYCVKYSALDALMCGFRVWVIADATCAVNLKADDGERSLAEMRDAGAIICTSHEIRTRPPDNN